jgi:hypothetical protein
LPAPCETAQGAGGSGPGAFLFVKLSQLNPPHDIPHAKSGLEFSLICA